MLGWPVVVNFSRTVTIVDEAAKVVDSDSSAEGEVDSDKPPVGPVVVDITDSVDISVDSLAIVVDSEDSAEGFIVVEVLSVSVENSKSLVESDNSESVKKSTIVYLVFFILTS